MECVTSNLQLSCPLADNQFYMLIETSGSNEQHDEAKLNSFLEKMMEAGLVEDGTVATAPSKQSEIWQLRERIAEALLKDGYCYKYDISLPLSVFYDSINVMRERLGSSVTRVVGYGHIGDGNMHLNITSPAVSTGRIRIQCRAIVGSISGQDYYEFGVNEMQQSGLVWSRL